MEPDSRQEMKKMQNFTGKELPMIRIQYAIKQATKEGVIMTAREILSNMKMIIKVMYKDYERMEHKGTEEYSRIELLEDLEELIKELKSLNVKA